MPFAGLVYVTMNVIKKVMMIIVIAKDKDDDDKYDSILLCSPWRALCWPDVCGVMGPYITHSAAFLLHRNDNMTMM